MERVKMKAMKWSKNHRDVYAYDGTRWVKVSCSLCSSAVCIAPLTLPRGERFDYNVKPDRSLEMAAEDAFAEAERRDAEFAEMQGAAIAFAQDFAA